MTMEEFNGLVDEAYTAAFEYAAELQAIYANSYQRQTSVAATRFLNATKTVTAAAVWTPPVYESLTDGMNDKEKAEADRVRDEVAAAILAILIAAGIAVSSRDFMEAISLRAQTNFEQEILRQLKNVVSDSLMNGLSSEEAAAAIRAQIPEIIPASAQMLSETLITSLVNERAVVAAQTQFQGKASKTWLTRQDGRVRPAHASAQGQTVPIDQPFHIGGFSLNYPGDPSGPLRLTARCRCRLSFTNDPTAVVASAQEDMMTNMGTSPNTVYVPVTETLYTATDLASITASTVTVVVEIDEMDDDMMCPDCGAMNDPEALVCDQCGAMMDTEDSAQAPEMMDEVSDVEEMDGAAWKCLLAVEGVATEDGRYLELGSLTWRDLPLSLMAMDETTEGGHLGAKVAGRIDMIWRDGYEVWGSGVFNGSGFGAHIEELVANQSLRGNSVDLAVLAFEYRDPDTNMALTDEQMMDAALNGNPVLFAVTEGVIMASTVCPTPAIAQANIVLASGFPMMSVFTLWPSDEEALTASAAGMVPLHPPAAWFANPSLNEATALTITPEGRVFGHAALWNSCHIGEPSGPGICVPPPRSGLNYEIFHHGACLTEEGHDVVVGQLTLGTTHAGRDLGWRETMEHYENSGLAFADVHAYEDRFGIVVAGALRPDVPATKVREAKAGALSGDWRSVIGRGLEFLAALVVNVPGFPIPRPEARIVASASGEEEILALVAAGIVEPADTVDGMPRREYLRKIRALTS